MECWNIESGGLKSIYIQMALIRSKDPGPKGPALVHPAGVIWVITFYRAVWFQVSGFSKGFRYLNKNQAVILFSCPIFHLAYIPLFHWKNLSSVMRSKSIPLERDSLLFIHHLNVEPYD
jgi:hypothetical protein